MEIAQEKGIFIQQGVKVESTYIENYFTSVSEFSTGRFDGIATNLGGLMNMIGKTPDLQIVLVTDQSAGADVMVVQRGIRSATDLKGKRLGTKLGDFGELFITTLLESHGLTTDEITFVNMEGEEIPAGLRGGSIQGGHTWEPYATQAVQAGARVLFTSQQTPGLIPDIFVFRSQVVRDRPQEVKAFVQAWFQAQDYWQAHSEESKAIIARRLRIKPETVSTDGIHLYTLKDNSKVFTPGTTTDSLYYTAQLYADFFIRKGGLSTAPDVQKLIVPSFVQQLQKEG